MTSKERVLTAVNLTQPDRVPMDFHGNQWVLQRLRNDLNVTSHRALLAHLGSDIVDLRGVVAPLYKGPIPYSRELPNGVKESCMGWRQKTVEAACGPEESFVDFPLASASTLKDLEQHTWPSPDWFDFSDFAAQLDPWQDFAVMASGASVWQHPSFLRGIDNLMLDLAAAPDMGHYLINQFSEFYLGYFDRMFSAASGRIDILRQADDLGTQQSLFFSPDMFRTFIKPHIAKLVDLAHSYDIKFMFHSCGAIRPVIQDLIDIGVDILDPLQAAAQGMDPKALKEQHGDQICLHGGICTQYLLPGGTPKEVQTEVQQRIHILGQGGGYILAPCHVLQMDVPTKNILAMSRVGQDHHYE